MRKFKTKDKIFAAIAVVLVLALVIVPLAMEANANKEKEVSYASVTAENRTISTTLAGTGTLTGATAQEITVPEGVLLEEFLVENGDEVTAGTALATVDKVSVMSTIKSVQETLDYIAEEMNDIDEDEDTVSGTVDDTDTTIENVTYNVLAAQHRAYEDILTDLFKLYQDGVLYATEDGVVSGVDSDSELLLSASDGADEMLLANAPNGDDSITYINYIGKVKSVSYSKINLTMSENATDITDYLSLATFEAPDSIFTKESSVSPDSNTVVYSLSQNNWQAGDLSSIKSGDTILLAYDSADNSLVWIVVLNSSSGEENPGENQGENQNESQPSENQGENQGENRGENQQGENQNESQPTGDNTQTGDNQQSQPTGDNTQTQSGTQTIDMSSLTAAATEALIEEEAFEVYSENLVTALSVTAQDQMSIVVTIDELDILSAKAGQAATVTIDALTGQSFDGEVTSVDKTMSNSGGNTKYTITITIDRTENMLPGMNASALIELSSKEDVLSIPLSAVYSDGDKTIVYKNYDKDNGLSESTEVEIGVSDADYVEIISGITADDTIWYQE